MTEDVSSPVDRQLTPRALMLGALLSVSLAAANAYLGLFAGLTVSASIPAAVVSMAILRALRDGHILENNIVQTAASAGEALAAGAIFTLPALVLLGYWDGFPYLWVVFLTGVGGLLGVALTVPLRHALIGELKLPFPEGTATAAVLRAGHGRTESIRPLLVGLAAAAAAKLATGGLRLWQGSVEAAAQAGGAVVYAGANLSPALLAVGYIVGFNVAVLVFLGGVLSWGVVLPVYAQWAGVGVGEDAAATAWRLWSEQIRYLGVGAMLVGGLWALWSMRASLSAGFTRVGAVAGDGAGADLPRAVLFGIVLLAGVAMFGLYWRVLDSAAAAVPVTLAMLAAALVFSAVAAYMAGLVGSSNNPVSGVTIATILVTALGLLVFFGGSATGAVAAVLVGTVVCCAAAIGGDSMQDLKAGALLGAAPRRQQIAQIVGVLSAMCVLAPILSLLLEAYGIGTPTEAHPDPLPAPQASLMAAVARGVFGGDLPWTMVGGGAVIGAAVIVLDEWLRRRGASFRAPVLAVAVGIYLPLELSVPIALGGLLAWRAGTRAQGPGLLAAAGLITGEALMGILLAVPIATSGQRDILALAAPDALGSWPGLLVIAALGFWLWRLRRS